jgi:HlyD family secretion protein
MKLFPGMTAYVSIPVADASNVTKVPNAALRFTPDLTPEQARNMAQKYGITPARKQTSADSQTHAAASAVATVWKLDANGGLQPVQIQTGITDHTFTAVAQVIKGQLNPGDQLAIGSAKNGSAKTQQPQQATSFAPGMGGSRGGFRPR